MVNIIKFYHMYIYIKEVLLCYFSGSYFYLGVQAEKGIHTLIFKNHIIFHARCTAAASLLTLCLECTFLATEGDILPLFNLW